SVAALRSSCRRSAAADCAASLNMCVGDALAIRRAELGNEVIGVAAIEGLAKLDRAAVRQESDTLDEQPRIARMRVQQLRLLGVQEQGAQPLQRTRGPLAR